VYEIHFVEKNDTLLLSRPTIIEHQVASRIAKTIDPLKNDTIDDPLVQMRLKKLFNSDPNLIIHYTHEAWLATYNTKTLGREELYL
jgi:hypothetical protein